MHARCAVARTLATAFFAPPHSHAQAPPACRRRCAGPASACQASALLDLQKRFVQQERQLQAATASAASSNASEGTQVEPYFAEEKVAQEVNILKHVEAQIEEVAAGVAAASAALPGLSREAQAKQVRAGAAARRAQGCWRVAGRGWRRADDCCAGSWRARGREHVAHD